MMKLKAQSLLNFWEITLKMINIQFSIPCRLIYKIVYIILNNNNQQFNYLKLLLIRSHQPKYSQEKVFNIFIDLNKIYY